MNTCYLYVVYDKIAGTYTSPFTAINNAVAIRSFNHEVQRYQNAEPSDFELYCLGSFDYSTGLVAAFEKLEFVVKGQVIDFA